MTDLVTRCPNCHTAFKVANTQLEAANGLVRCGACLKVFDGFNHLAPAPTLTRAISPAPYQEGDHDDDTGADESDVDDGLLQPPATTPYRTKPRDDDNGRSVDNLAALISGEHLADPQSTETETETETGEDNPDNSHLAPASSSPPEPDDLPDEGAEDRISNGQHTAPSNREIPAEVTDDTAAEAPPTDQDETILSHPDAPISSALMPADLAEAEEQALLEEEHSLEDSTAPADHNSHDQNDDGIRWDPAGADLYSVEDSLPRPELQPQKPQAVWLSWCLLAVLALAFQGLYFQAPSLAAYPMLREPVVRFCHLTGCTPYPASDLHLIETRELVVRSHPREPGALLVEANIINQAPQPQPYPPLTLTFEDLQGTPVASRSFSPAEYLNTVATGQKTLMPVAQPVRIRLEIVDPGASAVSFTLSARK